jgi:hypothetical protein
MAKAAVSIQGVEIKKAGAIKPVGLSFKRFTDIVLLLCSVIVG